MGRATVGGLRALARDQFFAALQRLPLRNTVFAESFGGGNFADSPGPLVDRLTAELPAWEVLWATNDATAAVPPGPGARSVPYRSREYFIRLATSRLVINNVAFPPAFRKRPGQVYVNTWHGTPLKKMGLNSHLPSSSAVTQRNFQEADVLVSSGEFMTKNMYVRDYAISNSRDQIVETGFPRVDVQFAPGLRERVRASLGELGSARFVLFAPTFRDGAADPAREAAKTLAQVREWNEELEDACVYALLHPKLKPYVADGAELCPAGLTTNELLGAADVLVTDYSSVCFDFLATGGQVIFLHQDEAEYSQVRGLALGHEDLPGPVTQDPGEVVTWLTEFPTTGYLPLPQARQRYLPHDDGAATERVAQLTLAALGRSSADA